MNLSFAMYSLILPIAFELAIAIPAANAPTIGASPIAAANPAKPKHEAVEAASAVHSDFQSVVMSRNFGRTKTAPMSSPSHRPKAVIVVRAIMK